MQDYYSIGEAAKIVNMTSETLRHYDRFGLVKPSKIDEYTKYRYYSKQDIVRLNTIHALQFMDLSLQEIKQALEYDDLKKVIDFFEQAEKKADEKIAELEYSKTKIQLAKMDYEKKLRGHFNTTGSFVKYFPKRVIMLSDTHEAPTHDNLWNYHSHFYEKISPSLKEQFTFEDSAGIYTEDGLSKLFALCISYADIDELKALPAGKYLCADCVEENRASVLDALMKTARTQYGVVPKFSIQIIVISGILKWNYQIQILVE